MAGPFFVFWNALDAGLLRRRLHGAVLCCPTRIQLDGAFASFALVGKPNLRSRRRKRQQVKQWLPRGQMFRRFFPRAVSLYKDRAVELTVVRRDLRKGKHW